jgi:hypothetical protein
MSKPVPTFSLADVAAALQPVTPAPVFGAEDLQGATNALSALAAKRATLERLYSAAESKDNQLRKQLTAVLAKDGEFRSFGDRIKGMTPAEVAAAQAAIAKWQAVSRWVTSAKEEQGKAQAAMNGLTALMARFDAGDEMVIDACTPVSQTEPEPEQVVPEPESTETLDWAKTLLEAATGNWIWTTVREDGIRDAIELAGQLPQSAIALLLANSWS